MIVRMPTAFGFTAFGFTAFGSVVSAIGACIALYNRRTLPRIGAAAPSSEAVTVCIPARDEAHRLPALIDDLRCQVGVPDLQVLLLDDDSTDDTADVARRAMDDDPRFSLIRRHDPPPSGWVGKTAACTLLAERAFAARSPDVVIFLDADVRLAPDAVVAAVATLRHSGTDLLTAWPAQIAESWAERLVQPLLCWSWASMLPMTLANASARPSTAVACGQFLVFDAASYRESGGHTAVFDSRTEDLDIARTFRRQGRSTAVARAGQRARCRMYRSRSEVESGYGRWLWSAYGSLGGSAAVVTIAVAAYVVPPFVALTKSGSARRWGTLGYATGVASRLVARSIDMDAAPTGRDIVDACLHPVSMLAYARLVVLSHHARLRGTTAWKGRALD